MPTTTTGLATSFITFSRPGASGGGATVTDADGKIKWAGHNLLTNSESFDASAWVKGGNTTITPNVTSSPIGTTTADRISVTITGGQAQSFQITVSLVPATYTAGCFLKADTASTWAALNLYDAALTNKRVWFNLNTGAKGTEDSGITGTITPLSNGWYYCSVSRAVTGASGGLSVEVTNNDNVTTGTAGNAIFAWGAHLYRSDMQMQLNPAMPAGMQSYYPTTPRNLLGNTENFSAASYATQGNTVTTNAIVAPNGLQTADLFAENSADTNHSLVVASAAPNAGTFTASVYAKNAGRYLVVALSCGGVGAAQFVSAVFDLSNGTRTAFNATGSQTHVASGISSAGDGWYRCYVTATLTASAELSLSLSNVSTAPSGNYGRNTYTVSGTSLGIYLWGAQLSDSASLDTYVPVYGAAVTSAAYYAPRLDFDGATLAAKGLLVEEQRVNLLSYSSEMNNASVWSRNTGRTTTTANQIAAPDGTVTATKVTTASANVNGSYIARATGISTSAGAFCTSVFVKKGTSSGWFALMVADGTNFYTAWFNLNTGAKGGSLTTGTDFTAKNFDIASVGNGWYRVWVTVTRTTTTDFTLYCYTDCAADQSYQSTLNNFDYLWGGQVENGTFPTSFIFTVGNTTATRTADVASVSTQAFPYSASEGTLVVSGAFISLTASSVAVMASLNNNNSTNSVNIYRQSALMQFNSFSGGTNTVTYSVSASTEPVKAAIAYKLNDANAAVNGVAQTTDTTAALPVGIDRLDIGWMWSVYPGNGWIRQITYIPRRLSNAELASRTAA